MDQESPEASKIHILKESCRICLEVLGKETKSLYSERVQHQIRTCTGISMERDDRLSSLICITCFNQLTESYLFFQKCQRSYEYLHNFLDKCNKIDILENSNVIQDYDNLPILRDDSYKSEKCDIEVYDDNLEEINVNDIYESSLKEETESSNGTKVKLKRICNNENGEFLHCNSCNFVTHSHSKLTIHMTVHNREKPYDCVSCGKRFLQKSSFDRHMAKSHFQIKIKRINDNTCEHCGKRFSTRNNLKMHRRIHTGETPYGCSFCEKRFSQMSTLSSHERRHTGEKPYKCKMCNKSFIDQAHLKRHQSVHSEDKPFVCDICNKGVKSKHALKQHLKIHTQEKEHICEQCGTSFMTRGNLDAHIRTIHSEKSGQCTICKKLFSNLSDHMVNHTGEKPFKCGMCDKSFSHSRGLNVHSRKHVTENKYKCNIDGCHRLFSAKWVLKCHMMKHTGNAPHICRCCLKGFFRICDLTKHMKLNHPNESN